jgi:acyl-CoA thioesterase-1
LSIRVVGIFILCLLFAEAAVAATASPAPTILVVGDSLSAGFGIKLEQGWVALLQKKLAQEGYGHRVVNASASGETSGGAMTRLPRALAQHRPAVVILELGGNDGLRGLPVGDIRANFERMIALATQAGARVLLIGMRMPPNYGPQYTREFDGLYAELARAHGLAIVPFFLDGVALDEGLMQDDGIHPTAAAQPKLLAVVWPRLRPLL